MFMIKHKITLKLLCELFQDTAHRYNLQNDHMLHNRQC